MQAMDHMTRDLMPHVKDFDAVACAGDFHGVALAAIAAAHLGKPLVIVCQRPHGDATPQVRSLGSFTPGQRLLYVDDFFCLGASWSHFSAWAQQHVPGSVVATYAAQVREYKSLATRRQSTDDSPADLTRIKDAMLADLLPHVREFEAIVCAWDAHGTALAAVAAAYLGKALVVVCTQPHEDVVSHIVTMGTFDPRMRLLHLDHGQDGQATLAYLNQGETANVVATYGPLGRSYSATTTQEGP